MATDWPGHGATNRHPHYPCGCKCGQFFTPQNEPPWVYLWSPIGTQSNARLEYLNSSHYLTTDRSHSTCRWRYGKMTDDLEFTQEIFLEPVLGQGGLFLFMEWRIKVYNVFINVEYSQAGTPTVASDEVWVRGQDFTDETASWGLIEDSPSPDWGPPVGAGYLCPLDCIPDWNFGDPIPAP